MSGSNDPRWGDDPRDRRDDDVRDRHDEDSRQIGRGPGSPGPRDGHSEDDPRIATMTRDGSSATATRVIETRAASSGRVHAGPRPAART
jgi:hypothetical protein